MTDLSSLFGGENSPMDVLNGLLDKIDIENKTELYMHQIKPLIQIKWFKELRNPENEGMDALAIFLDKVIPYYLSLLVSLKRQSRTEIIDGLSNLREELMQSMNIAEGLKK